MSWFTEFNLQIDWHNHCVQLDLEDKQHTVIAEYVSNSFPRIELYTGD